MNKKVLSAVIALALSVSINAKVMAAPSNGQAHDKTLELEEKIQNMDNSIQGLMYKIEDNNKDIEKNKEDISKLGKDIEKAQKQIESREDLFNKRVRAMYISGFDSYADIILESEGLSDLLTRVDTVKKVMGFDQGVIKELKTKKEEIKEKKVALDKKSTEIAQLKAENEKKLASVKSEKSKTELEAKNLRKQKEEAAKAAQIQAAERQAAQSQSSVSQSRGGSSVSVEAPASSGSSSSNSSSKPSNPAPPATHGDVVGYAMQFQGVPYVWGGTSPSGFDCSGFVQYVYRNAAGIELPRDTYGQIGAGPRVSQDQLQPGDLVFPHTGHVGIYIGGGQMIHAPHTGDVVKISSVYKFYAGVRVR
ncbi:NlpC/P60 family protein [Clostridium sporogenes]|uniref:C40 family peptidase n=1 Tax=Clostridium sporogenes TaxID=1509 RepID=UPI002149BB31|nr:C40 family peptidase [Clostridium sporogenes]MCR1975750.1 NlpC/P60 family protein [Clostridium sporogenes]